MRPEAIWRGLEATWRWEVGGNLEMGSRRPGEGRLEATWTGGGDLERGGGGDLERRGTCDSLNFECCNMRSVIFIFVRMFL